MKILDITIGNTTVKGYEIELPNAILVLVAAPKGYVMCGYLNIEASDKFKDVAAIVKGVSSVDELLAKEVSVVSAEAIKTGIKPGMSGRQAVSLML